MTYEVAGSVGFSIAVLITLLRLAVRLWRRTRLSLDDAFALLAMLLLVVTGVAGKIYYSLNEIVKIPGESTTPQQSRVALFYLTAVIFNLVIWIARLSILATILSFGYYTAYLRTAAGLFCVAMMVLLAQVLWVCEPQDAHNHWKSSPHLRCVLGKGVAITKITTDAFADVVLGGAPLLILRHLKSDAAKAERIRLSVSFAVGGLTTVVSIVRAYYLLKNDMNSLIIGTVEMSVSVIICNFSVLAAALHRAWSRLHPQTLENDGPSNVSSLRFGAGPEAGLHSGTGSSDTAFSPERIDP
ncbi:hypothetical protein DXG01_002857 [Tephrocybe rancida]|nr:hypothetical protein DXG01_002857 [Tephrocybe rancida]